MNYKYTDLLKHAIARLTFDSRPSITIGLPRVCNACPAKIRNDLSMTSERRPASIFTNDPKFKQHAVINRIRYVKISLAGPMALNKTHF